MGQAQGMHTYSVMQSAAMLEETQQQSCSGLRKEPEAYCVVVPHVSYAQCYVRNVMSDLYLQRQLLKFSGKNRLMQSS